MIPRYIYPTKDPIANANMAPKSTPARCPSNFCVNATVTKTSRQRFIKLKCATRNLPNCLMWLSSSKLISRPKQSAHVILFTSDLELSYQKVIDYYSLRFQIEFNFRDAKQFWGLEDFMNTTETAVTNAVNLSFFMVNLSYRLLRDCRQDNSEFSLLDLKACFRGYKYVEEVWKLLPQKPDPISWAQILVKVANLGAVHPRQTAETP